MILPEDPEKEALQRQLDAHDQAIRDRRLVEAQGHPPDNRSRTSLEGYTGLALPPPPYNPGLVHRSVNGTNQTRISSRFGPGQPVDPLARTPLAPPIHPQTPLVYHEHASTPFQQHYPYSYPYPQAEASTSQVTLPSTTTGNDTREQFEIDDSHASSTHTPPRRRERRRIWGILPTGRTERDEGALPGSSSSSTRGISLVGPARRDKGKRREWQGTETRGIKGLLEPHSMVWRRWSTKRWIFGIVFVLVSRFVTGLGNWGTRLIANYPLRAVFCSLGTCERDSGGTRRWPDAWTAE